jgi:iron(III) transport system permease protein
MVTLSAVIFLFSPAANVASVTVMQLEDGGNTAQAAAFSTLIMVTVVAVLALFQGLLRLVGVRNVSLIG